MAVELEGGCRVTAMSEGTPDVFGTLKVWKHIGKDTGAEAVSLRVFEFGPGTSPQLSNAESDEVLFVLDGEPEVQIDERVFQLTPDTGIFLEPGRTLQVNNSSDRTIKMVSCRCPDESSSNAVASPSKLDSEPFVRLADRKTEATADRWYRVLIDDAVGSEQVTQFVGSIPPGRAPDHFHHYEEVLFILRGEGRMWAGKTNTPIGRDHVFIFRRSKCTASKIPVQVN